MRHAIPRRRVISPPRALFPYAPWVHSLLTVSVDHLATDEVLRSLSMRRAHLWLREFGSLRRSMVVRRLLSLPPACKLVSLDIGGGVWDDPLDWSQVVSCPCIQQLRSLTLAGLIQINTAGLRTLAALPRLASLRVFGRVLVPEGFAAFAASPSLTFLHCYDTRRDASSVLSFVLACPTLQILSVSEPESPFLDGCSPLFALPGMERIRELTLAQMVAGTGSRQLPPGITAASPAALLALQSFTIRVCYEIDKFLRHLRLAPALRSLTIESQAHFCSAIPSPGMLIELLTAVPALVIRVRRVLVCVPRDSVAAYDAIASSVKLRAFATRFALEVEE